MRSDQRSSGLAIAALVMAGLSIATSLLLIGLLLPSPPDPVPQSGSPYTGGYVNAANFLFRLVVLVIFGLFGLVFTSLTAVYGAIGACRTGIPWQRVSCWVSLAFTVAFQALALVVGVYGLIAAGQRR